MVVVICCTVECTHMLSWTSPRLKPRLFSRSLVEVVCRHVACVFHQKTKLLLRMKELSRPVLASALFCGFFFSVIWRYERWFFIVLFVPRMKDIPDNSYLFLCELFVFLKSDRRHLYFIVFLRSLGDCVSLCELVYFSAFAGIIVGLPPPPPRVNRKGCVSD